LAGVNVNCACKYWVRKTKVRRLHDNRYIELISIKNNKKCPKSPNKHYIHLIGLRKRLKPHTLSCCKNNWEHKINIFYNIINKYIDYLTEIKVLVEHIFSALMV